MPPNFPVDGHQQLIGVHGGSPDSVPPGYAHQAVNRFFRETYNDTRPLFQGTTLQFESVDQQTWFEAANGQGATFYNSYPSTSTSKLVCSLGGRIYTITIEGNVGIVKMLFDGNSREFMHAWFAQGFQWLVIQDGIHPSLFWDGATIIRRSDIAKNEMPIGSVMAFIHGRFVVASSDGKNSIYVGDIAYGETLTTPDDILKFTEQTYWAEGGYFNTPINVGNIMGLYPMPFLDTGTGQNELVVGCQFGFTSLDLSGPRTSWIDTQVQRVALVGDGLVSSHGFAGLNGDMFFRSQSGVNTYRNARIEYSQRWNQTPISREVNYWLKPDRRNYLEFIPMVSWQNMVFCGSSPQIANPTNPGFGKHRFCRGMVVFDADNLSTASRSGSPVWHGMWSGVRPWAFAQGYIQGANRCFVFSYDQDGRNRLYEMTLRRGDDVFEGQRIKIESSYTTGMYGSVETVTNPFDVKRINGGVLEFSQVLGLSSFEVQYRPDGTPCYVNIDSGQAGCDCPVRAPCTDLPPYRTLTALPQWGRKYFQQPSLNACTPGSKQPATTFHHCQVRINATGSFVIDRMRIRFELMKEEQIAECSGPQCQPITCCPNENDYAYQLAPAGVTNPNIPVIPSDGPARFMSTRVVRICCPAFQSICVVASGSATSDISQADADSKAAAVAQENAQLQLVCPTQSGAVLDTFCIDGGAEDLSAFFAAEAQTEFTNQPWILKDLYTDETIASGTVDEDGTMQTYFLNVDYTHGTFDPGTGVYTDAGGGNTCIGLLIGTNYGGEYVYPSVTGPYGE